MDRRDIAAVGGDETGLKDRRFVTVYDFMGADLGLKGAELLVYARIFGFARYGKPFFESKQSTAEFFGLTRRAVFDATRRLKERGLIEETAPCEEAARIGSRCYRPCGGALGRLGIRLAGCEEPAYEDSSPGEPPSHEDRPADEDSSPPGARGCEGLSPSGVNGLHPIRKRDNRHFGDERPYI